MSFQTRLKNDSDTLINRMTSRLMQTISMLTNNIVASSESNCFHKRLKVPTENQGRVASNRPNEFTLNKVVSSCIFLYKVEKQLKNIGQLHEALPCVDYVNRQILLRVRIRILSYEVESADSKPTTTTTSRLQPTEPIQLNKVVSSCIFSKPIDDMRSRLQPAQRYCIYVSIYM